MTTRTRPLREPTFWFLLVAAVVHVVRQNLFDVVLFVGTAVLILVDARGSGRDRPLPGWFSARVAAVACTAFALLVLPMARTGWPLRVAIGVPGVLALVVVLRSGRALAGDRPEQDSPARVSPDERRGHGWLAWPALLVAGCAFELFNFVNQPDPQTDSRTHPTLSALVDPLLQGSVARAAAAALWLAVGFWLLGILARSSRDREGAGR